MLSVGAYMGILLPIYLIIPALFGLVLMLIPVRRLADLTKMVFGVEENSEKETDQIIINFHGNEVNMENRLGRLKMVMALVSLFAMVNVVFIDGCVLSTDTLTVGQVCPNQPKDCFIYDSPFSTSPSESFVCSPGDPVIPANSSAYRAFCYRYILSGQKTIDILNQLGICTGVLSLSANVLWALCWMASQWWGLLIQFVLVIGGFVAILVIQFARVPYELLTLILVGLCLILIATAIYIVLGNQKEKIHPDRNLSIETNHAQIHSDRSLSLETNHDQIHSGRSLSVETNHNQISSADWNSK